VIEERPVDFYVTHLYMSRGDDSLRLFQVQQLLQWIDSRADSTTVTGNCAAPCAEAVTFHLSDGSQRSLSDQPAESSGPVTDQRRGEEFGDRMGSQTAS
jgi:hypothetical protein